MKLLNNLRNKYWLWLGAIIAVYAAITLGNMNRWSIWFDEAFSAYIIRFNFAEIAQYTAVDVHPPLYYWLLKAWSLVMGTGELGVRSLSMAFGIVAIVGVFMLVRRLFNSPNWALWASAAVALSPLVVRFGHEARMYTMALAIVIWATYILVRASEKGSSKWWWVGYGLMISAGMWTHYYTALAWLGHWAWRFIEVRAGRMVRFFTKEWIWSHVLGVGLFLWWLPIAFRQFGSLQAGFWIPDVGAYTAVDYVSNLLLYQQYGQTKGWWALIFILSVLISIVILRKGLPLILSRSRSSVTLLLSMAIVPPLLLAMVSMPPLTSTFMDRYILYAQVFLLGLVVVAAAALYQQKKPQRTFVHAFAVMIILSSLLGIGNVYYYGNYNKNSNTSIRVKEVLEEIDREASGQKQPVIADNPWVYYEAAFYSSDTHPVYFLDDRADDYRYGSLQMLKDASNEKIDDIHEFTRENRYVWYMGYNVGGPIEAPYESWRAITDVEGYDYIEGNAKYRATLYDTRPSAE